MNRLVSSILIILLAIQAFYPLAIYSYYYANKGYISSILCENKEKPQLHCNGKCYLKKQLKKAEEEDKNNKTSSQKIEAYVYIITPAITNTNIDYRNTTIDHTDYIPDHYDFNYLPSCFRPPCI